MKKKMIILVMLVLVVVTVSGSLVLTNYIEKNQIYNEKSALILKKIARDVYATTMTVLNIKNFRNSKNIELIKKCVSELKVPLIAEGKIHYPYQLKQVLDAGAYCAVVGGAITRPHEITQRFVKEIL